MVLLLSLDNSNASRRENKQISSAMEGAKRFLLSGLARDTYSSIDITIYGNSECRKCNAWNLS